jgi:hypothetical protein
MGDVVLLKQEIVDGRTEELASVLRETFETVADGALAELLRLEGVYTESVFVERTGDTDYLVWYFETEGIERVAAVFEDLPEHAARVFDDPEPVLGALATLRDCLVAPEEFQGTDVELVAHLVNPDRPGDATA